MPFFGKPAALITLTAGLSLSLFATPASAASLATWERVAHCESTDNWKIISRNGLYYGGLQISKPTWDAYGGRQYAPYANQATKQQQILIAEKILRGAGEKQWDCAAEAGLTNDGIDPYPKPTPPIAGISAPDARTVLTGTATLTASVTDQVGTPLSATFLLDGSEVGTVTGTGPTYNLQVDTSALPDGPHTLEVRAANDAGQTGPLSSKVSVFTANRAAATQTTGDFNGDGKDDIAILYGNGQQADGSNQTALWTLLSKGTTGFADPVKTWDNLASGTGSWDWNRSKVTTGDFNGDGRTDIGVLYNNGQQAGGVNQSTLWTFTSTGAGFAPPVKAWQSSESWNWDRSKLTAGDFNGDGKSDIGVLYNVGEQRDGSHQTALWTFTSTGAGFGGPQLKWDNDDRTTGSWNWDRSKLTAGDFDGDGKSDIGVLYNVGEQRDGSHQTALWTFTSTGA
ncbi:transglycosylase family protein, partial [Streptomyces sp. NPDC002039]|uniref:transglycosylase family protein n=2 Tax=unclassified Streptomyces TaxID=2593676 RepID=UPI003319838C